MEATQHLPELKERTLPAECREELHALLKEVYGYDNFRSLEIYDNLFESKDKILISQGQLIEYVVREVETVLNDDAQADNLLLTAPTGSGKSLLFQLPSIYIGRQYGLLTIVVSPLKALIVDQVEGLRDMGYERVAYASSDLSPEQKAEEVRHVGDAIV